jgi:hypothetical protein
MDLNMWNIFVAVILWRKMENVKVLYIYYYTLCCVMFTEISSLSLNLVLKIGNRPGNKQSNSY